MIRSSRDDIQYQPLPTVSPNMSPFRIKWTKLVLIATPVIVILIILTAHLRQPSCNKSYLQDYTVQHIFSYCNSLSQSVSGQEGTVPPSDGYKLETVYMAVRHGDRSNIHSIQNYKPPDLNCKVGERIIQIEPRMKDYLETMITQTDYHKSNPKTSAYHDFDLYPNNPKCGTGELTPTGAAQHLRAGAFLKKRYVDALNLFDGSSENIENKVVIRATSWSRTFQSAVAFLYGFLPKFDMSTLAFEQAEENPMCTENSATQCSCPAINKYIDTMACTLGQFTPRVMAEKTTRMTYDHLSEVFGVLASQLPRPSHVFDVSMVHACHHQLLPGTSSHKCMQPWAVGNIFDIINNNGKSQVTNPQYQKIARLKMHPLLTEIKENMEKQRKDETPIKFMLFSGHDSTIEPLAAALNFSDGHWSRYASRIVIELYSKTDDSGKSLYVRTLYDGSLVTDRMDFCKGRMKDEQLGLCPFEEFQRYVEVDSLKDFGSGDFKTLCTEF